MHLNIGPHVPDDVLEKYLLRRLPEAELAPVEEHLLVCSKCQVQAEETQEFILVTQAALQAGRRKSAARALHATSAGILNSWLTVPVFAGVIAAVTAAVFLPLHHAGTVPPASHVTLSAMRGPETTPAHVHAGSALTLDLDATGLPAEGRFAVRVVDSHGSQIWSGVASNAAGNRMSALVGDSLRPGRYWVRLSRNGELLREYGLQID
jgi:hypothetical protein